MSQEVESIFREAGAILEGHFLLTSGLHSSLYLEKFRVLQYPAYTERLCGMIARRFRRRRVQVVAGPTTGGIIIAFEVARQLGVKAIFAEEEWGKRVFRRGLMLGPGERVLVVDDILTTGGSICEVLAEVAARGGQAVGVAVLVNRAEGRMEFGVPFFSCARFPIPTYPPEECPLCRAGIPLERPGGLRPEASSAETPRPRSLER